MWKNTHLQKSKIQTFGSEADSILQPVDVNHYSFESSHCELQETRQILKFLHSPLRGCPSSAGRGIGDTEKERKNQQQRQQTRKQVKHPDRGKSRVNSRGRMRNTAGEAKREMLFTDTDGRKE